MKPDVETTRRTVLKATLGLGALALAPRAAAAAESALTPQQTEGPFYPVYHRLDEDNDLTFVATRDAPASGAPVYVGGRVLDAAGTPV
ncbi:MAG TPA: intradiol ring-cleavage dioxygenase, partial [Myxococcota bacterium]|nr:intradiol ring-cleavage dioxygenase [Myxococcota bacterium]